MTPFRRGKGGYLSIYVPTHPGLTRLPLGTTDMRLAKAIEAEVKRLAQRKRWTVLRALADKRFTVDAFWEAAQVEQIDELMKRLDAKRIEDLIGNDPRKGGDATEWIADAMKRAPAAWRDQVTQVKTMTKGLTYAHELTSGEVRKRVNQLTCSGSTARHHLYALSAFCNYCIAVNALQENPCESRSLVPRPKAGKKRTEWRTEDVDRNICSRLTGSLRIAAIICCASSADRATPLQLRVKHLHLLPVGVEPDPTKDLEHRIDLPGTKEVGRDRKGVRLEPWAAPILRAWIADKHPEAMLLDRFHPNTLTAAWREAADEAGEKNYWLRDTRHSYGCRAFLAGYSLWEITLWLGHGDASTTADIYLQMSYEVARLVRASGFKASASKPDEATVSPDVPPLQLEA